jgi:hypothetical protein
VRPRREAALSTAKLPAPGHGVVTMPSSRVSPIRTANEGVYRDSRLSQGFSGKDPGPGNASASRRVKFSGAVRAQESGASPGGANTKL